MLEPLKYIYSMNRLNNEKRAQMLSVLVEGNSLRATARICDVAFNTVLKFVPEIGKACAEYQDKIFRNLDCKRIECDEIWSFVYSKQKNVPESHKGEFGYGDVWTWVAIDADTKLVVSWLVADRGASAAMEFMQDLAGRLKNSIQLTTDGHKVYLNAVENAFGGEVDYAMLVKIYGNDSSPESSKRYSPAAYVGADKVVICGNPNPSHVSTSYVERQNLTMRMSMRRFTRLTNGFSKKVENHAHHIALHYMYYNFCRIHKTLRITPAMAAGVTDHVWGIEELVSLLSK
jgi:IS1 family transposase